MIAPCIVGADFRGFVLNFRNVRLIFNESGWWVWSFLWGEWIQVSVSDVDDVLRAAGVPYRQNLIYGAMRRVREGLKDPNFGKRTGGVSFTRPKAVGTE